MIVETPLSGAPVRVPASPLPGNADGRDPEFVLQFSSELAGEPMADNPKADTPDTGLPVESGPVGDSAGKDIERPDLDNDPGDSGLPFGTGLFSPSASGNRGSVGVTARDDGVPVQARAWPDAKAVPGATGLTVSQSGSVTMSGFTSFESSERRPETRAENDTVDRLGRPAAFGGSPFGAPSHSNRILKGGEHDLRKKIGVGGESDKAKPGPDGRLAVLQVEEAISDGRPGAQMAIAADRSARAFGGNMQGRNGVMALGSTSPDPDRESPFAARPADPWLRNNAIRGNGAQPTPPAQAASAGVAGQYPDLNGKGDGTAIANGSDPVLQSVRPTGPDRALPARPALFAVRSNTGHEETGEVAPLVSTLDPTPGGSENRIRSGYAPHTHRPATMAQTIVRQIAEALPRTVDAALEITLHPEELGRLRLTLSHLDGSGVLTVIADRPETLDLVRRHVALLSAEFAAQGFAHLDVSLGNERGAATERKDAAATRPGPQMPDETESGSPVARGSGTAACDTLDIRL